MELDRRGTPLWHIEPAPEWPPLTRTTRADVCVVGLGGSGLSAARELCRLGASVVGLDAGRVGGGAAGRNGGFLLAGLAPFYHDAVASHGRDRARAIYALTLLELDRIATETPVGVVRHGSLRIAESEEELADCAQQLDALRADGFPVEPYDGHQGRGLLIPGDGTFQPFVRCHALAEQVAGTGAQLHERSCVTEVSRGCVRTQSGSVQCDFVIVAVDGRLEVVLPELVGTVRSARLQMLATAPTTEVHLTHPVYARWGYDYWHQRPDGSIALGGARDLAEQSEWTTDAEPTDEVQRALERRLRNDLGVHAPITHRWAATVGYTTTGLPVVGEVRPGVWAIGGYCGTGNVVGSLLGRGLARWYARGDDSLIQPFVHADD